MVVVETNNAAYSVSPPYTLDKTVVWVIAGNAD